MVYFSNIHEIWSFRWKRYMNALITKLNYHDVVVGAAAGNGAGKVN
jgi:hypothetical protein